MKPRYAAFILLVIVAGVIALLFLKKQPEPVKLPPPPPKENVPPPPLITKTDPKLIEAYLAIENKVKTGQLEQAANHASLTPDVPGMPELVRLLQTPLYDPNSEQVFLGIGVSREALITAIPDYAKLLKREVPPEAMKTLLAHNDPALKLMGMLGLVTKTGPMAVFEIRKYRDDKTMGPAVEFLLSKLGDPTAKPTFTDITNNPEHRAKLQKVAEMMSIFPDAKAGPEAYSQSALRERNQTLRRLIKEYEQQFGPLSGSEEPASESSRP